VQIGLNGLAQDLQWELFDTLNAEFIDLPEGVFFSGVQNSQLQVKNDASIDGLLLRCRINSCAAAIFSDPVVIHSKKYNPVYIPNSFSPNEDQENPEFKVYIQGDVNLKISVFSRWGELLYSSDDAQKGWDGTANGRPVPEDVYIYKVSIKQACGLTSRTGSVHLMR
jgi:gliding motility-associated-like protein